MAILQPVINTTSLLAIVCFRPPSVTHCKVVTGVPATLYLKRLALYDSLWNHSKCLSIEAIQHACGTPGSPTERARDGSMLTTNIAWEMDVLLDKKIRHRGDIHEEK